MDDSRDERKKPPFYDESQILDAIERSGFALEAEVGRTLLGNNWLVRFSVPYLDFEEKKNREIDLVALYRKDNSEGAGSLTVRLIIECKKRDHGLIAIGERRASSTATFSPSSLCVGSPNAAPANKVPGPYGDTSDRVRSCFEFLGLEEHYPPFRTQILAHQILKIDSTDSKKIKGLDSAIPEIAFPIAKATKALGEFTGWEAPNAKTVFIWTVNIPVVVLRGPLWYYDVNQQHFLHLRRSRHVPSRM